MAVIHRRPTRVKKTAVTKPVVEEKKEIVPEVTAVQEPEAIEPIVVIGPITVEEEKIEEPIVPVRKKVRKIIEEIEQEVAEQE